MNADQLIRKNIRHLKPYQSARSEHTQTEGTFLDANENSLGSVLSLPYNRYPDPLQKNLRQKIAEMKQIRPEQLFIGNGSDEAIDLLIRAFCEPAEDRIIICPPTYGVYCVFAQINNVCIDEVPLKEDFQIDVENVLANVTDNSKLIFICSPNNPTANLFDRNSILKILKNFNGLLILDEAYIDFAAEQSWLQKISSYPNLIVLQTFSKAWGLASLRVGMAMADEKIINILHRIKYPYNLSGISQNLIIQALKHINRKQKYAEQIIRLRDDLADKLSRLPAVTNVFPSQANFLLIRFTDAKQVYHHLLEKNIIVRDRSNLIHCHNCLRITVGRKSENIKLIRALSELDG